MILDQQYDTLSGGVLTYPDFPFSDVPRHPQDVREAVTLDAGTSAPNTIYVGGSLDQWEGR